MEWQEALKINDEWNVKQKVERERLDAERVELMKEEALLKVMDYEQRQQDQIKIIDELIRAEKVCIFTLFKVCIKHIILELE